MAPPARQTKSAAWALTTKAVFLDMVPPIFRLMLTIEFEICYRGLRKVNRPWRGREREDMKVCVAGAAGAFGMKHLEALGAIEGVEVTSVMGVEADDIHAFAAERGIAHASTDLAECLARDDVDAVILATPTPVHAAQAIQCLKAGKHVLVEIPMADNLSDAQALVAAQKTSGKVAMAGHVRRFNPVASMDT